MRKPKLMYKGYLDLEEINKEMTRNNVDGITLHIKDAETGETDKIIDIERNNYNSADGEEIEGTCARGILVHIGDIIEEIKQDGQAVYGIINTSTGEALDVNFTFKLLEENK